MNGDEIIIENRGPVPEGNHFLPVNVYIQETVHGERWWK